MGTKTVQGDAARVTRGSGPSGDSPGGSIAARFAALVDMSVAEVDASQCRDALACVSHVRQWLAAFEASVILRMREVAEPEVVAVDLALSGRLNRGQVRGVMERADTLDQFELFAGALADGAITSAHVDAVSRGLKTLGVESAGLVAAQGALLEQALLLPAEQFGKFLANEVERQSAEKANEEFDDQRRSTNLKWWNNKKGMVRLSGAFDPERGAYLVGRLENAVEAIFHGPGGTVDVGDLAPGVEANDHRRAVALLGLVGGAARAGSVGAAGAGGAGGDGNGTVAGFFGVVGGGVRGTAAVCSRCGCAAPAEVGAVCGECGASAEIVETLAEAAGGGGLSIEALESFSVAANRAEIMVAVDLETLVSGVHEGSVRRVSTGADLPVDVIRRMACEASVIPAVLNGQGVVVDIGRARRLATRAQRQAIFAMHSTCAMPECSVRVGVCAPHHIDYWESGGRTDLSNLVPLCSRHHHAVHEGGWKMSISRDRTVTVVLPDGREMSRPLREKSPRFKPRETGTVRTGSVDDGQVHAGSNLSVGSVATAPDPDPPPF